MAKKMTAREKRQRGCQAFTMSIPAAGAKFFGLSRNGSYEAAKRGDIPTIDVGRLKRVPVRVLERKLEGEGA